MEQSSLVIDSITAKKHPHGNPDNNLMTDMIRQIYCDFTGSLRDLNAEGVPLAFVDKKFPHALLEVMVMEATNGQIYPSIYDQPQSINRMFSIVSQFAHYCHNKGLVPSASWSYDPDTSISDRESGQGLKRFHAHLIGREGDELLQSLQKTEPLKNKDKFRQRRLADESIPVLSNVLEGVIRHSLSIPNKVKLKPPVDGLPCTSVNLESWDDLNSGEVQQFLMNTHYLIEQTYIAMINLVSSGYQPNRQWESITAYKRPKYNFSNEAMEKLKQALTAVGSSPTATEELITFLESCKPDLVDKISRRYDDGNPYNKKITSYFYPAAGPCYSTSILEKNDGKITIALRPYLFSDLGSAGLTFIHDGYVWIPTKIKKGIGEMTQAEMSQRISFQQEFIWSI